MPNYSVAVTGVNVSRPILLDTFQGAGNTLFQVVVSGTVTYTVEHCNDPTVFDYGSGARTSPVTWFPDTTVAAKTANAEGSFLGPMQWVRLNVTAGTGTATLSLRQPGPGT